MRRRLLLFLLALALCMGVLFAPAFFVSPNAPFVIWPLWFASFAVTLKLAEHLDPRVKRRRSSSSPSRPSR